MCVFCVLPAKKRLRKLLGRVVKNVLVVSTVTIWGKLVLWRFVFFFFLGSWKKLFAFRQKKLSQVVKKSFYLSKGSFFLLENFKCAQMFSFCVLSAKTNLRKLFGRLVESALVLSTAKFWKKNYFSDESFFFWVFHCKFYALWQNKLIEIVKTSFTVFAGFFYEKKFFFKYLKYFRRSCTLSRRFWAFSWEKAGMVVKT